MGDGKGGGCFTCLIIIIIVILLPVVLGVVVKGAILTAVIGGVAYVAPDVADWFSSLTGKQSTRNDNRHNADGSRQGGGYRYRPSDPPPGQSLPSTDGPRPTSSPSDGFYRSPNTATGPANEYRWVSVGIGDCAGMDYTETNGSAAPAVELCSQSSVGKTAVCWDMVTQRTEANKVFCTYKNVAANSCTGGHNIGYMYSCMRLATQ